MKQKEKLEEAKRLYKDANADQRYVLERLFPELKEPEDEKIKEALINTIKCLDEEESKEGYSFYAGNYTADDCIAWLKKQGKQKPADTNWSKEDEEKFSFVRAILIDAKNPINCATYSVYYREVTESIEWLKSIKDRVGCEVNCTTKKEWSEEDEKMLKKSIKLLDEFGGDRKDGAYTLQEMTCRNCADWLKSIKEKVGNFDDGYKVGFSAAKHNQWKPSEEELDSLSIAIPCVFSSLDKKNLQSLYNSLKKL